MLVDKYGEEYVNKMEKSENRANTALATVAVVGGLAATAMAVIGAEKVTSSILNGLESLGEKAVSSIFDYLTK